MLKIRAMALCGAALGLALSGCGGGGFGQETLHVSVSYSQTTMNLFTVSSLQPTLRGFDGHDQRCDQSGGILPVGVHINDDCTISGRPTQVGNFNLVYKVSAEDADGSFDSSVSISVNGPRASYPFHATSVRVGNAISDAPQIGNWVAPTDGTALTWSYHVATGALPAGLTLNPTTGVISGTATAAGVTSASIQATLSTVYGSYTLAPTTYQLTVQP